MGITTTSSGAEFQQLTQSFLGVHAKPFNGCPQKIGTAALNQGLEEEESFTPRFPDESRAVCRDQNGSIQATP